MQSLYGKEDQLWTFCSTHSSTKCCCRTFTWDLIKYCQLPKGNSDLPEYLWAEAVMQAVEILNICPTFANQTKIPFEVLHRKLHVYNNLHIFNSNCFVHLEKSDCSYKFGAKSWEGRFFWKSPEHSFDTYCIWNPVTKY